MSDDIVISVENVSKAYRIWNDPGARLKSPLISACGRLFPSDSVARRKLEAKAAANYRDFYATKDISVQVRKGESVGIIGRNGSGKSTLLQIIAGTLQPTTGSVRVNGRVAALLELGSGFNPEFTGRENVYLNAAVLGLTKAQTDAKFDSIAAFADIGDFLDQPVKTYSSGMLVRLAFSVQTSVDPDILIIDEALAVGDIFFQIKCHHRLQEITSTGTTLLFVSHDLTSISSTCSRVAYLRKGHLHFFGDPKRAIHLYTTEGRTGRTVPTVSTNSTNAPLLPRNHLPATAYKVEYFNHGIVEIGAIDLSEAEGPITTVIAENQPARVSVFFRCHANIEFPIFTLRLINHNNTHIVSKDTRQMQAVGLGNIASGHDYSAEIEFTPNYAQGPYLLTIGLKSIDTAQPIDASIEASKLIVDINIPIHIRDATSGQKRFYGLVDIQSHFRLDRLE